MCFEDKAIFTSYFSKDSIEISKKNDFVTNIIEKQYLFYKKIDDETVVSLDGEGTIEIVLKGNLVRYKTEFPNTSIAQYIKNMTADKKDILNEIEHESTQIPLGMFINLI